MSIKARLTLLVILLVGIFILQAGVNLYYRNANDALTGQLVQGQKNTAEISGLAVELQKIRRYEKEYFIYAGTPDKRRGYASDVQKALVAVTTTLNHMEANREGRYLPEEVARIARWHADLDFYASEFVRVVNQVESGSLPDTLAANAAIGPGKDRIKGFVEGTAQDGAQREQRVAAIAQELNANRKAAATVFLATTLIAILVGAVTLLVLYGSMVKPLEHMADVAGRVSRGELGVVFPASDVAEFRSLSASLERMRTALATRGASRG